MEQCTAVLISKCIEYKTLINLSINCDDELTFHVNGIKISVEFDGNLYIENYTNYKDEQLTFLTFYKKHNELFLTNYSLKYCIPISVINKVTNSLIKTYIFGEMKHEGTVNSPVQYLYQILNAKSTKTIIDYAINELQNQLSDTYNICICGCCRYAQDNPYGGDFYLNYLCFKNNKHGYLQFTNGIEKKDWEFFMDKKNIESTRPTYSCKEFEPYPII